MRWCCASSTSRRAISFRAASTLPEAKGGGEWLDRDTLLLFSAFGDGMATVGVRAHRAAVAARRPTRSRRRSSSRRALIICRSGAGSTMRPAASACGSPSGSASSTDRLDRRPHRAEDRGSTVPTDASVELASRLARGPAPHGLDDRRRDLSRPTPSSACRFRRFLAGDRHFQMLFEPAERRALQGFFWCGGRLVLSILDNLRPVFEALTPSAGGWPARRVTGLPDDGVAIALAARRPRARSSNGDLLASAQDPLTPASLFLVPPGVAAPAAAEARAAGLRSRRARHHPPRGGVERRRCAMPYIQVGPPGETGDAPVHLYGYGGFAVSQLPTTIRRSASSGWSAAAPASSPIMRGGGEFGTAWHEAGRREGKRLSHDDFAAVAADLVRRGVTRPGRIAAEGGSNGGILITNMLTRYPERFGALFCTIPLIDMRRYTKLLAGASWIAEYGDPDKPEDWAFLNDISAYHAAVPGRPYPPILIATSRRDDRVHPGHARKMAAKLQAMGYEAYFYEPAAGGHGYGKDNSERAVLHRARLNFLRRAIGWHPSDARRSRVSAP